MAMALILKRFDDEVILVRHEAAPTEVLQISIRRNETDGSFKVALTGPITFDIIRGELSDDSYKVKK
jgi:hypothetical protein